MNKTVAKGEMKKEQVNEKVEEAMKEEKVNKDRNMKMKLKEMRIMEAES